MNDIHVCFSTDNNYAPYCGVAIKSMLVNAAPDDDLHVYILHINLGSHHLENFRQVAAEHNCELQFIQIDAKDFEDLPLTPGAHTSSTATYFRLAIPRLLPNLDRVIYLDCDILVRGSLAELFHMDMKCQLLAAAKNWSKGSFRTDPRLIFIPSGFNSGVMLIDCQQWRYANIEEKLFKFASSNSQELSCYPDEKLINLVLNLHSRNV